MTPPDDPGVELVEWWDDDGRRVRGLLLHPRAKLGTVSRGWSVPSGDRPLVIRLPPEGFSEGQLVAVIPIRLLEK